MKFGYKHAIKATAGVALATGVQAQAITFGFENMSPSTYTANTNHTETVGGVGIIFRSDLGSEFSYGQFVTGGPIGTGKSFVINYTPLGTPTITFTFSRAVNLASIQTLVNAGVGVNFTANGSLALTSNAEAGTQTLNLSSLSNVTTLTLTGILTNPSLYLDNLIFELANIPSYETQAIDGGGQSPARGSGRLLDQVVAGNNNTMSGLFTALNSLTTDAQVAAAADALAPVASNASVRAGNQIANNIQNIVELRQNVTTGGGLNSGDTVFADKNIWVRPFATKGEQDDKNGFNGFNLKAKGLGIGMDTEYKDNRLGLAFFYTNADVNVNNVSQNADLDVYTVLLYGSTPVLDSQTDFMYQAAYAWQKTKTTRTFNFGGLYETANANFTSKTASLDLKLARKYRIGSDLLLRPVGELTYRHYETPEYAESGAINTNQAFAKATSSDLILGFGALADYSIDKNTKIIGNVNVGYDLRNDLQSVTYSYVGDASGASATSTGIDNGRWEYKAGIGIERTINEGSNINIMVDRRQEGTTFSSNTVSAKYVYKF